MSFARPLILVTAVAIVAAPLVACGGGEVRKSSPPKRAAKADKKDTSSEPDPFDAFGGKYVALGEELRLGRDPVAINGARVIVQVMKSTYLVREKADGTEVKDATAHIRVQKGSESVTVRIGEGGAGRAHGVKIFVAEAGDYYDEVAADWLAFAVVTVTQE